MSENDYELLGNIHATDPIFGAQKRPGSFVLKTHGETECRGEFCCIHKPSDHALKDAPLNWRADRYMMERICEHGIGHPDPDDLAFKRSIMTRQAYRARAYDSHGCDGCC